MKIATLIIIVLASAMTIFNFTKINFNAPFTGESMVAIITIVAGLCAIALMLILRISKKIEKLSKKK